MEQHEKQHPGSRVLIIRTVIVVVLIVLLLTGCYMVCRRLETKNANDARGDLSARYTPVPTFTWQGASYRAKADITTVLFIGVDQLSETRSIGARSGGQADFLLLLVIDDAAKTITPLQIDRDTMAEISILNVLGKPAGTRVTQICLSHGFGSTAQERCELTVKAVSGLLLNTKIDYYAAINLDGISALNDAAGGIAVTLADDFSALDAAMTKGTTLTLKGRQAEYYVRSRYGIADSTNRARMERQRDYLSKLSGQLNAGLKNDADFAGTLFDAVAPYLTTNMRRGRIINEAWSTREYAFNEIERPTGTYMKGSDGFVEFHADADSIKALVTRLFCEAAQ